MRRWALSQLDMAAQPLQHDLLRTLESEAWLVKRLREQGVSLDECSKVLAGVTDTDERRERLRHTILSNGMSTVIVGRHHGKSENYQQCFERLYGEKL